MVSNRSIKIILITIIIIIIVGGSIVFYLLQPKKTISPISKPQENQTIPVSLEQPSRTLKVYTDDSGFSFKYPDDVQVSTKDINDTITYADLELTSNQTKGSILIKIADTKLKSVDDWFKESKLISAMTNKKEIKISDITGSQVQVDNKLLAAVLNQDILFTIEVDSQNQKYWLNVYGTILSSFNFVPQKTNDTATQSLDDSNSDAVLEEDTIE